jgi:hypothetical protein
MATIARRSALQRLSSLKKPPIRAIDNDPIGGLGTNLTTTCKEPQLAAVHHACDVLPLASHCPDRGDSEQTLAKFGMHVAAVRVGGLLL